MNDGDPPTHAAALEETSARQKPAGRTMRGAHRLSALLIGAFLLLHLANHLVGLFGQQEHVRFMHTIRPIYRNVLVEPILLVLLTWQLFSGLRLLVARGRNTDGLVAWLQIGSGAYLAFFLLVHVLSVLVARHSLGVETDFGFAAAGLHNPNQIWFFAPYYTGSILALATHIGCATSWALYPDNRTAQIRWIIGAGTFGFLLGALVVLSLGGAFFAVRLHV